MFITRSTRGSWMLRALFLVLVFATVAIAVSASGGAPRIRTLVEVNGRIRHVVQDGDRIAWMTGRCRDPGVQGRSHRGNDVVAARDLGTGQTTTLTRRACRPNLQENDPRQQSAGLALAGTRVVFLHPVDYLPDTNAARIAARTGAAAMLSSHRHLILAEFAQATRLEIVRDGRVERVVSTRAYAKASWAPDGTALAFWKGPSTLSVASGDGRNPRALLRLLEPDFDWAPRGHRLAVPLEGRIFSVDVRTGRRVAITAPTRASYRAPHWSPTGRLIAYVRDPAFPLLASTTIGADLMVARSDGSGPRELVALYRIKVPAGYDPGEYQTIAQNPVLSRFEEISSCLRRSPISWSPTGDRIAFMLPGRGSCRARTVDVGTARLRTVPKLLRQGFVWSPDGGRVAVVAGKEIVTARIDGRDPRTVVPGDRVFGWWPDGTLTVGRVGEPHGEGDAQTYEVVDTRDQRDASARLVYRAREDARIWSVDRR